MKDCKLCFTLYRAKDTKKFQLFSKGKRNLYAPTSAGNEMVTLRSTSPPETDEAKKKENEARMELEASQGFVPVPESVCKYFVYYYNTSSIDLVLTLCVLCVTYTMLFCVVW